MITLNIPDGPTLELHHLVLDPLFLGGHLVSGEYRLQGRIIDLRVLTDPKVVEHGHFIEIPQQLKGSRHAKLGNSMGR